MESLKNIEEVGMEEVNEAILYVNGVRRVLPDGLAHLTLLEYLRDIGLTGTKLGCGEGGCGACTVMLSYYDQHLKRSMHYSVNACLAPLYSVEGMHIITVEGIGNRRRGLHPVQESLACAHGSQCGYCTPGFVMSMYALLRSSQTPPSEEQIEESLTGNLCRCTGYRPIIDAFRVFAKTDDALYANKSLVKLQGGEFVCCSTGKPCSCGSKAVNDNDTTKQSITCGNRYKPISYSERDGSTYSEKELIFPPELLLRKLKPLNLGGIGGLKWYRPLRFQHVLDLKERYPDAKLVVGNTEVGIEMKLKRIQYQVLISVAHVPELNVLSVKDEGLEIGAAVRLTEFLEVLRKVVTERDAHETSSCKAFIEQIKWFAGKQIKNVASVGGNICTASPISDLNPLWMAAGAKFQIVDCKGNIRTTLAGDFFLGYRKVDLASREILLSVFLPWTRHFEYVKGFKQAHRRDDDIAIVNAGMRVSLEENGEKWEVTDALIVYGGVAPVSFSASKTKDFLIGKSWDQELLLGALREIEKDIMLKEDAPGGMVEFRKSLTLSFLFKFFLWVSHQMDGKQSFTKSLPSTHLSAIQSFCRPSSIGGQDYEITKHGTAVGSPEVHLSSRLQVTGEAEYADDTPMPPNSLHAALVLSGKPHARILSIDDSGAKSSPGFAGLFLSKDVPGDNNIGAIVYDEELFASEFVTCVGQVIGVIVAETHEHAKLAARKVHIEYEDLPAIFSIRDALKYKSFHPNTERWMRKGDVELCFQSGACDKIIEGEVQVGGQEHFYLETQSSLIWTLDGGSEVHMISSTQVPNASATSASASSDMYGAAVLDACEQIKERMEPVASRNKLSSFAELASACYMERIDLSAHGFYITPDISFDWKTGKGNPFRYFTYGAAFAEVEIDTLTGDFHTRTANIFLDLGYSLNPAIDVGQIEGAFIQGVGWFALEELKWGDAEHKWIQPGYLYTCGPGSYKLPSVNDIPLKFNVSLLKGVPNLKAIHSSKAVGEPPFFLASAVFFAIKDAIIAARAEVGCDDWFPLDNPATPERIRMACTDDFTKPFVSSDFRPKLSV